jgi:DNA polymerase-1
MLTLLIDGDILVYQVAARCQKPAIDWGDGVLSPEVADLKEAISRLTVRIVELKNAVSADHVKIALKSETELFRRKLYPLYKANRSTAPVPMLRGPLMKWLVENKPKAVVRRPGLEGDDILGILGTMKQKPGNEVMIWSIDKDLRQIPGNHLVMGENDSAPLAVEEVSEEQGNYLHMIQTLTGDAVDNYKGLPGCGPVKAARILENAGGPKSWWADLVEAYVKAGLTEADALVQARCARILRASDYDFKRKEPILWLPPRINEPE